MADCKSGLEELERIQNEANEIPVSMDISYIKTRVKAKVRKRKAWVEIKKVITSVVAVAVVFIVLANTSTVFAAAIADIPFLNKLAEEVKWNKGYVDAVENNYAQYIGENSVVGENQLELVYVLADENRLVPFFRFNQLQDQYQGQNMNLQVIDLIETENQKQVEAGIASSSFTAEKGEAFTGFECVFDDSKTREYVKEYDIVLKAYADTAEGERSIGTFTYHLSLNAPASPLIYKINKVFEVEGQHFTVTSLEIYPTVAKVTIEEDNANTQKLKGISLSLFNEKKEEWGSTSGLIAMGNSYYIASNYFTNFKSLSLVVNEVALLDKQEAVITVDCNKEKIVNGNDKVADIELRKLKKREDGTYDMELTYKGKTNNLQLVNGYQLELNGETLSPKEGTEMWSDEEMGKMFNKLLGVSANKEGKVYLLREIPTSIVKLDEKIGP